MKKLTGTSLHILKTLHLLFIVLFFGGLSAVFVVLSLKKSGAFNFGSPEADMIIYRLDNLMLFFSLLGLATTSVIYGLFTNWGILKYRWLIIKWLLLFILSGIYMFVYSPSINGMVSLSNGGINSDATENLYKSLLQKSSWSGIFLLLLLLTIFFISTIKPFGKRNSDILAENKIARISIIAFIILSVGFGIMGSLNLKRLRNMKITNPDLLIISDGKYIGEFSDGGGVYKVEVEINNHTISQLTMKTDRESPYVDYARPVMGRIVQKQTLDVDAVTGATTTSKCIMKAAENALKGTRTTNQDRN